ncbi:phosphoadenosine phosphosulfate reductase family protein [Caulobacter sp. CCNWLY153]|uniref:phosphoadenosine phosphosulfate reductase domain-containing protein n=1 Tax=unclassified Caulobacter TaxID=2648921 RepID=UPI002FF1BA12
MSVRQADLLAGGPRMPVGDAATMTLASLQQYGPEHDHWAVAWSGGKDSTALLTLLIHFLETGQLQRPTSLTVFYADTRMELPPLQAAALLIIARLRELGVVVEVVMAPMDKRFLVYMLGRGVPPPNNNTLRWCTRQIKVDPMAEAIGARVAQIEGNVLMLTGVRQGESAVRDARIALSCSKDGGECGQGWYQQVLPSAKGVRGRIATLAPLLHWRVCGVWDWLKIFAPMAEYGAWPTRILADAYGGDEAEEVNARTGCIGCPLASQDKALSAIVDMPGWEHMRPLLRIRPIYRELRQPHRRLKKTGFTADGAVATAKNKQRMGPLTLDARTWALGELLAIQEEVNTAAAALGRPGVDFLNSEEVARIRELVADETWPNGWDGDEPTADTPMDAVYPDGAVQPLLSGVFA